ncbi:hypothetical protein DB30_02394 [Enhygromyxa salina]|uniref:Uncharacterized protein n=1 Tax=Enhygromyxa salina TaxID=215803 RepID=A0A0C2CVC7_9BACT|nr:hypothetical protein [Enhygromyxa salina]KIG11842.1 hypothetical protein DB30_02394 [Enhygromyxa salina]
MVDEGEAQIGSETAAEVGDGTPRDWSLLSLGAGLFSIGWATAILWPGVADLPAWPAASVGVFALAFAGAPGRPLPRGLGAFLGTVGLIVGAGKILALWGLLELIT